MGLRLSEEMLYRTKLDRKRDNNFNLLRMIAAMAVLVSHAYPLAAGPNAIEPLQLQLGMSLGGLAVCSFFAISGYFISQSFDRTQDVTAFVVARVLRIYPGLIVALILTVLIIGPIVTSIRLNNYFSEQETFLYIPRNLSLAKLQYELPGVFNENPLRNVINGSLWTLIYEVGCYGMVVVIGLCGFAIALRFGMFLLGYGAAYIGMSVLGIHGSRLDAIHELTLPFIIGMSFYHYRKYLYYDAYILVVLSAITLISYKRLWFEEVFILTWCYFLFFVGMKKINFISNYNRLGDYSYGTYIYAFPVEQITAEMFRGFSPLTLAACALAPTLGLAVLSWHLVERPANNLRASMARQLKGVILWLPSVTQNCSLCKIGACSGKNTKENQHAPQKCTVNPRKIVIATTTPSDTDRRCSFGVR